MSERMQNLTGKEIITANGVRYRLGKIVRCEAQGVVYEESFGEKMIKLYYLKGNHIFDEDMIDRLRFIQNAKMARSFISIEDIITEPYIGYVMKKVKDHKTLNAYLIPDKEVPFSEWYNRGLGLRERLLIGYSIAKCFGSVEKRNLSYCDISGNNILIQRSQTGITTHIIDTDNIYVAGKGTAVVLGAPRYIAPEVVSRQRNPDVLSDSYSLAVILFELLRVGHPYVSDDILDGLPEEEEAALVGKSDYVTEDNSTNMLPADVVFTDKLKKLFQKCFVDGKRNRLVRPSAREFAYALLEASNQLIKCPHCGAWYYSRMEQEYRCPWCDALSKPKARLSFYDFLSEGEDYKYGKPIGNGGSKPVNWYILRDGGQNRINSLYVLRADDPAKDSRAAENYLEIERGTDGYWANNAYAKDGIKIQKNTGEYSLRTKDGKTVKRNCRPGECIALNHEEAISLDDGDLICFELNIIIEVGKVKYSFIRVAKFLEETQ